MDRPTEDDERDFILTVTQEMSKHDVLQKIIEIVEKMEK